MSRLLQGAHVPEVCPDSTTQGGVGPEVSRWLLCPEMPQCLKKKEKKKQAISQYPVPRGPLLCPTLPSPEPEAVLRRRGEQDARGAWTKPEAELRSKSNQLCRRRGIWIPGGSFSSL